MNLAYSHASPKLFLEDLTIGQRFVSRTHQIDVDDIKSFAAMYDP